MASYTNTEDIEENFSNDELGLPRRGVSTDVVAAAAFGDQRKSNLAKQQESIATPKDPKTTDTTERPEERDNLARVETAPVGDNDEDFGMTHYTSAGNTSTPDENDSVRQP